MTSHRHWLAVIVVFFGLLTWVGEAQAACTSSTVSDGRGGLIFCTTCCSNGYCSTTCF